MANETASTWRDLFEQYGAALVLYARQWGGTFADSEDVVQEVFVKMIGKGVQPDDPANYLFASVRNAALDQQRSASRRKSREQSAMERRPLFESEPTENEEREAIEVALSDLPQEQREVVVMKIWGELTFEAIARVLDVSPNTAASRFRYAIKALRQTLEAESSQEALE